MADISQIKLPNGDTFDLVDEKSGYLSSETDPVFSASAASSITSTNITNWNNKANLWTVDGGWNDDNSWWDLTVSSTALSNIDNRPGSNAMVRKIVFPTGSVNGHATSLVIQHSLNNQYKNKTLTLPNDSGTLALTSQIPTIPTNVSSFTNDSGYLTLSTLPIYDGTVV